MDAACLNEKVYGLMLLSAEGASASVACVLIERFDVEATGETSAGEEQATSA